MFSRPSPTRVRRIVAAGITSLALVSVAACGGDDDTATDGGDAGKANAEVVDGLSAGDDVSAKEITDIVTASSEAMDTARVTMETEMTVQGQDASMSGEGIIQMDPLMQEQTMTVAGQEMTIRYVDDVMYMNAPITGGGKQWLSMDIDSFSEMGMGEVGDILADPTGVMNKMVDYIESATYEGSEDIDGVEADHYVMTLKGADYAKELGVDTGQLPKTLEQDMWVDEEGRLVRTETEMGDLGSTTQTYSDFGVEVDVKAPPENEVTDLKDAMGGSGLGG